MKKSIQKFIMFSLFIMTFLGITVTANAATHRLYTISSGNTRVYSDSSLRQGSGWIYGTDEVKLLEISTSYCKVEYPVAGGKTRKGYVSTGSLFTATKGKSYTSRAKILTYRRPNGYSYGYISKDDAVFVLGTSGSYTQLRYPVLGGYKYAFVKTSDCNNYIKTSSTGSTVSSGSHDIPNGWYMIISGNSDDRVLDINNWNKNNGGNLEIYSKNNTGNQRFQMIYLNNGYYAIKALHSGKYLHIQDENNKSSNVHQWEGYNHKNAQWALKSAGNGYYYIQNRGNGSYLDNSGSNTRQGNNVISYPYNGSNAQKWKFVSTSDGYDEKRSLSDGWYEVQSANNNSYVWDIDSGINNGKNNDANLEIYQKHGGNNQKFYLKYLNNGYYAIMSGHSNKYLHKQNSGHSENVVQWESYSTSAIQTQWAIASEGNGYYVVRAKAGNYVDNSGATTQNGNNVITYLWNGTNAQKWRFVKTSAPGTETTSSVSSETYYVSTTAGLILRRGPGSSYTKILTMPYGSTLKVSSISNGWAKAIYSGYEGYCSSSYISKTKPNSNTGTTSVTGQQKNISAALYNNSRAYISCGYDGYTTTSGRHEGIDIRLGNGNPIYSLTDGVVVRVAYGASGANGLSTIAIYNSSSDKTVIYLHANPVTLNVGQTIKKGMKIGTEGWRGCSSSSGSHTHVEVRNGKTGYAAKSVNDYKLENPNPSSFWKSQGYNIK